MASTIVTKNSSTASAVPLTGDLTQGELAVNVTDKRLFTKNSGGTVVELGTNPASLALPNGTANGVAYLNGSKVVTTGSALVFDGTKLGIGGAASQLIHAQTAGTTGYLQVQATSGSAYYGVDSAGVYIGSTANIPSIFNVNGAEQMRLTTTGLGIGTSSPIQKLDVRGRAGVYGASDVYQLKLSYDVGTAGFWLGSPSANALAFYNDAGTERMRLDSSGNLGLGVTPSAWTTVTPVFQAGRASFYGYLNQARMSANYYYSSGNKYIASDYATSYAQQDGQHQWYTAPSGTAGAAITTFTQAMTLDASGNLGIGTTSPTWILSLRRDSASGTAGLYPVVQVNNANASGYAGLYLNDSTALAGLETRRDTAHLGMHAGGAERARIDSSGNLLVGTTSAIGSAPNVIVKQGTAGQQCFTSWNATTSGNAYFHEFGTEGTYTARGSITYNRALGQVAYNVTSDYRAKDVYGPVINSGDVIDSVPVYMAKMKDGTIECPMFIAHETPEYAHTGEKDAVDDEGNPIYQQLDTSSLVPVLWAEVQSLRKRLAAAGIA